MKWKNSFGETAEIERFPHGEEKYIWRLSQATIQSDSPFSQYPGYKRWLVTLDDSIVLNDKKLPPLTPVIFSGEEKIFCIVPGKPVNDLGLIFDPAKSDASMSVVEGKIKLPIVGPGTAHFLYNLQSGDTLKIQGAAEVDVSKSILVSTYIKQQE